MTTTPPTDDNHGNSRDDNSKRDGESGRTSRLGGGDHPRGGRHVPHGTEPTSGETYNSLSQRLAGPVNTAELTLVAFLTTIGPAARLSAAQAVRRRGHREAVCYAHAADLAVRMPALFDRMRTDSRYSVEHLEIIWTRINRHARALAAAGQQLPATVDEAVATRLGAQLTPDGTVWSVPALGDATDGILTDVAPVPVADTEDTERKTVGLTRRGTRFTLECGDRSVADGLWEPLSAAALEVRKELLVEQETLRAQQQRQAQPESGCEPESAELVAARRIVDGIINPAGASTESGVPEEEPVATLADPLPAPGMIRCRGEAMLKILGGHRDQLKVVVNVYTPRTDDPDGPGGNGGPDGGDTGPDGTGGPDSGPEAGPTGPDNGDGGDTNPAGDASAAGPAGPGTGPETPDPVPQAGPTAPTGPACGPGFVIGNGWVSPTTTATLIEVADLVRDLPDIEDLTDTGCYRFTTLHRATAVGRDARCRFPGCRVPADRCELDHIVNSPFTDPDSDGPTSIRNCACLCRTHHQLKTRKLWKVHTPDDGITLHWAGPAGVTATTVASGPLVVDCATGTDPGGPAQAA
ncbi:HNH endonuclease signature motif containing protein [Corynebacterium nuruki]|uniref:HNH endonuclease signature motif containing protein n=2 Tax=Corynebacterium nuruki TaxID=1032851 RepID=UPI0011BF81AC|nr:HNH endonuclease signature motif containing protein [Corynebacterium nuruki]